MIAWILGGGWRWIAGAALLAALLSAGWWIEHRVSLSYEQAEQLKASAARETERNRLIVQMEEKSRKREADLARAIAREREISDETEVLRKRLGATADSNLDRPLPPAALDALDGMRQRLTARPGGGAVRP